MNTGDKNLSSKEIAKRLYELEHRVAQLESGFKPEPSPEDNYLELEPLKQFREITNGAFTESRIGKEGLAWLGNIVLFFGMAFLVQYIQNSGHQLFSTVFGYLTVTGIFILAHFLKKSYVTMASIFNLNAFLLLFYVTLGLHFFTKTPLVGNKSIGLMLVTFVAAIQLFIAIRKRSKLLAGTAMILVTVIAIISDTTHFMLPMAVVLTLISVFLLAKFGWIRFIFLSIILAYTINLIWLINNPFMGHPMQVISNPQTGFIYIYIIAAVFSLIALMPAKEKLYSSDSIISSLVFNGIVFSILIILFLLSFFEDQYVLPTGSIAMYSIVYSIVLMFRSEWKITAALYALYGFVTLSVTIYGIYDFPRAYFLLALQSLLVVTMAIWFRSRFIVIMNSILFIILLILYLSTADPGNLMNISFSIVGLATARILNWKKELLTIQTDFIRNVYLVAAFVMVLFTLYHLLPGQYITLSWTLGAVVYFLVSLLLKNPKYRYMALGSMIAAALYLFIHDLAHIELVYRIIALLFLAIISISISFYYTHKTKIEE